MTRRIVRSPKTAAAVFARHDDGTLVNAEPITWPSAGGGGVITHISLHTDHNQPVVLSGGGGGGQAIFSPISVPKPCDEPNVLEGGEVIVTHRLNDCDGYWCCIHNPSPHHMRGWTQTFNFPMKAIMRVCACGEEHPDPDDKDAQRMRHSCNCGHCSPKGRVVQKRRKRVSA